MCVNRAQNLMTQNVYIEFFFYSLNFIRTDYYIGVKTFSNFTLHLQWTGVLRSMNAQPLTMCLWIAEINVIWSFYVIINMFFSFELSSFRPIWIIWYVAPWIIIIILIRLYVVFFLLKIIFNYNSFLFGLSLFFI